MFALADVNSFYASVEKVFRPEIRNEPVIILSNNDGCVIARSKEAKPYVRMGEPWFQVKDRDFPERINVFSSNYALYHSLSQRVMACLEERAPHVEQYSIDEMFIDATGISASASFEDFGRQLRTYVRTCTGLTIGVGFGISKTLAKSAQWAGKEWPQFGGVLALRPENPRRTEKLLSLQPVEEVWGVGRRIGKKLQTLGIRTALDLARARPAFIRKTFSVVLERTVRELNGESCIPLEDAPPPRQQIVVSRSFGERITDYDAMRQAVCSYAERVAEKLREDGQYCHHVASFLRTSPFDAGKPGYGNTATTRLSTGTRDSRDIIQAAVRALDAIWRPGFRYAKAGVMLSELRPDGVAQLNLFEEQQMRRGSDELMDLLDAMNRSGRFRIGFAGKGIEPAWQMKREMLSPAYTTRWGEIPKAHLL
ncbi:DNA polymerase V subunit UmuC [Erwinia sp. OLTSP20]|uniref:translesion error-prone DNA polymerase V subunit UmuC n=1 Tax=unclassified Erwinia TaxID=2622719 RepID=UPI000C1944D5|nr:MULTISPECIES: translesion error-prone DNA polymerase V subunit UmuC [unclassified Erwinia]PIJ50003.1 DNA polymerase V subunit UmuC [Erwinia sp. OAMSP11]PIJ72450.1 DNA polymerase V subunit UmuC [Erwinia sp. OLSSP12]PIJ80073.1 DNA polymerase V subunit UmuC [Erwinia sp. OLCASP19]PIJ82129.1 DNA polymerase V subunit UmuC [Erwinia sp. OLMTSP26]PIJ86365.1 DNA polymerase V subunit UmuC [Erwinia sp. OLMDSP33]